MEYFGIQRVGVLRGNSTVTSIHTTFFKTGLTYLRLFCSVCMTPLIRFHCVKSYALKQIKIQTQFLFALDLRKYIIGKWSSKLLMLLLLLKCCEENGGHAKQQVNF